MGEQLPRYDPTKTYRWNYENAPPPVDHNQRIAEVRGDWDFVGLRVDSPLGIAAGPLLNGKWCLYYAALGFDVLTYKTVRSGSRECYPLPNLQPVACQNLSGNETGFRLRADARFLGSFLRNAFERSRSLAT